MRIVLAPFSGETHDRAALADAAHGPQPLPAQTIGLFVRLEPVDAIGVSQGIPGETVKRGHARREQAGASAPRWPGKSPMEPGALPMRRWPTGAPVRQWQQAIGRK
jgi:hypothetical protein